MCNMFFDTFFGLKKKLQGYRYINNYVANRCYFSIDIINIQKKNMNLLKGVNINVFLNK